MTIAIELLSDIDFQKLDDDQRKVVMHDSGPMMVIAGPGSGKTQCLVLRAMNLLLLERAKPHELVLCTYTKKAAFEMQDRLSEAAKRLGYDEDISTIRIGTIHSICERIVAENLHRLPLLEYQLPPLGNEYKTLDELSQRLFIFENLEKICRTNMPSLAKSVYTKWDLVKRLQKYFDKLTEELIDVKRLAFHKDSFLSNLPKAYTAYQNLLASNNCVDFAFLLKIAYDLLLDRSVSHYITGGIRYVLVDEYQDTNYIQAQILIKLSSRTNNIFVIGDEDQSLYRFRGATIHNIRDFFEIFPDALRKRLTVNYRSHPRIIDAYNKWMTSIDWKGFRYNKKIQAPPENSLMSYPAIFTIPGRDIYEEADQFAEFVFFLKEKDTIVDYNQVALLMSSVKIYKDNPRNAVFAYIDALKKKDIPVFCPRAGTYFYRDEIRLMVGCLARIFKYEGGLLNGVVGDREIYQYVNDCYELLSITCDTCSSFEMVVAQLETEIAQLEEGHPTSKSFADYFYILLANEPFAAFLDDVNKRQNLVIFSQLLKTFQNYYHIQDISFEKKGELVDSLFNRFLCLLYKDGMNEYENPEQPFPKGHVLLMTIHQAKGLEFSVVAVGSLDKQVQEPEEIDNQLGPFYPRRQPESADDIPLFDFMRKYYVAFSRAANMLVLMGNQKRRPAKQFNSILQGLPEWPDVQSDLLNLEVFKAREWFKPKPRYSYTGHIRMYETCPRQYQFYREYQFVPSHPADTFMGLLVHQTIEKIHRIALDKQIPTLTAAKLRSLFEQTCYFLSLTHTPSFDEKDKEKAYEQVENYFYNNQFEMYDVKNVEEQIAIMKNDYILTGKIDVVMERDGKREIWDLKTSDSHQTDPVALENYERQLYMYAHALEQRDEVAPDRLVLYWTERSSKDDAVMVFPYRHDKVDAVVEQFEAVVNRIKAQEFEVEVPPHPQICKKCDLRSRCIREGIIKT